MIFDLIARFRSIRQEAAKMQECGYLGPPPKPEAVAQMHRVCAWANRVFLGEVVVVGREKLDRLPGRFAFAANHGSPFDVSIMPLTLGRAARYPAAQGVTSLCGGLVGWFWSRWGVFSVNLDNGHAAADSMANVLKAGEIVVIFPEAWTWLDGELRKFKSGIVRFTRRAAEESGEPVFIVPAYIHYHRYPGAWVLKFPMALQWALLFVASFYYGRGAVVVVGDPINTMDLPDDPHEAIELVRSAVLALKPQKVG